jgi:hypothetical protein
MIHHTRIIFNYFKIFSRTSKSIGNIFDQMYKIGGEARDNRASLRFQPLSRRLQPCFGGFAPVDPAIVQACTVKLTKPSNEY